MKQNKMKQINSKLSKAGLSDVRIGPSTIDGYPYALFFDEDNPSQEKIDKAKKIVDAISLTEWHPEDARTEP